MKKIAIIGASVFQNPLILRAKELGYETHVFAWRIGAVGEKTADFFYPISIAEKEEILKICKEIKPQAVVSIGSDLAVLTVNYLSRQLGLNCNCEESDLITTNKYFMRQALQSRRIWTPAFMLVEREDSIDAIYKMRMPLIVKPTDRSGSRGVCKVEKVTDIVPAVNSAVEESFEKKAIVEEFIEGEEYSCECISYQGEHSLLAITRKFTTGAPHYVETGHVEPADIPDNIVEKIKTEVFEALDALKISDSVSHCEFKLKDGQVYIIEVGARMGGDCIGSHLVRYSTGYDFMRMVIDVSEGRRPDFTRGAKENFAMIRFFVNDCDDEALEQARHDANVKIMEVLRKETKENCIIHSALRNGYFILCAKESNVLKKYYPQGS